MLHPLIELRRINDDISYGVFAKQFIPKGTITWVIDHLDRVFTPEEDKRLDTMEFQLLDRYCYRDHKGHRILCWDFGRYMNHSCVPNTLSPGFHIDIAIEDILPNQEVVTDYGSLNLDESMACRCGSAKCRNTIQPGDFERLIPRWDQQIASAIPLLRTVKQPLWPLLQRRPELKNLGIANTPIPSIRQHFWKENPALQNQEP